MGALMQENALLKAKLKAINLPGEVLTVSDMMDVEPMKPPVGNVVLGELDGNLPPRPNQNGKRSMEESRFSCSPTSAMNAKSDLKAKSLVLNKFRMLKTDPFADSEDSPNVAETIKRFHISSFFMLNDPHMTLMQRFTGAMLFRSLSFLAIGANTVYLGYAADLGVRNAFRRLADSPAEPTTEVPGYVFVCWFAFEILVKMIADGKEFFVGEDKYWNAFDLVLVLESISGYFLDNLKLSFLRIFRVFRLVRVVKMVKSVKALAKLRTMIFAIMDSFVDLCWAFLVLFLILFVFGIVFSNAAASYVEGIIDDKEQSDPVKMATAAVVKDYFGDLGNSMLSLWSAVSGGNDWMTYGEPLMKVSMWYFALFIFYIGFSVVGLFNVVTGVFVDGAVCCRTGDEVVQSYLDDLKNTSAEIKSYFKEADTDGSGHLSFREFDNLMKQPAVKAYFAGLDIDPEEASVLFTILDSDRDKEIAIDEFVNGTMKMKGAASKLDLVALMYDSSRHQIKFDNLCEFVEQELHDIKRRLPQPRIDATGRELPRAVAIARRI
eukprot:TRINITY_DN27363_c0_g1_i1.p1 TRINITY_DN27363_c0_g1~~TRINITY_DN27363_c0_g1_i1.p1  ORF type:complete len:630 (+),score=127.58 TRINITY_DN27363_c0_g1_i1:248-1891(+)